MGEFSEPREIIEALMGALNAGDAQGIGDLFVEDGVFVNVRGTVMRGSRAITEGHAASFAGPLAGSTFRYASFSELQASTDVIVIHAHTIRGRRPDAPEGTAPELSTVLQLVARRAGGGWKAVAASNVPEVNTPSEASFRSTGG
jgi:uncharacterized protein (TIGR02246 family)